MPDNKLNFSTEANLRRESISNASNLKKGSCHRSYTFWRKGLNGLNFDSQSSESGCAKRERKDSLLIDASILTVHFLSLWFSSQSFFLFSLVFPCVPFLFPLLSFLLPPLHPSIPFHCSWLPLFIPSAIVRFTIFVPQLLLAPYGYPFRIAH